MIVCAVVCGFCCAFWCDEFLPVFVCLWMEANELLHSNAQRVSSTREDDFFQGSREAKLDRLGVKVNGFYQGATRAIPLPIFDETQWDHYLYDKGRDVVKNQQERQASDVGMHVLQTAGVTGKRLSNSPVCGKV